MTTEAVTLYTKPSCVQCNATKRWLDKRGIDYTTVDLTEDAEAFDYVKSLGYQQAPVVSIERLGGNVSWSGFDPNQLEYNLGV